MQFSRKGESALAGRSALQEIQRWVTANPGLDHSIAALARRVEVARVESARRMLEGGSLNGACSRDKTFVGESLSAMARETLHWLCEPSPAPISKTALTRL